MTARPSSQELADRVRSKLIPKPPGHENCKLGICEPHAALDDLVARLQATEQALREIEDAANNRRALGHIGLLARRALEGAAE